MVANTPMFNTFVCIACTGGIDFVDRQLYLSAVETTALKILTQWLDNAWLDTSTPIGLCVNSSEAGNAEQTKMVQMPVYKIKLQFNWNLFKVRFTHNNDNDDEPFVPLC